ncbi:MAG TPA: hypothetical protein H9667_00320 [Firmicutes bacterium]|nr:hypothetical protein [Bacillota bacterium]
MPKPIDTSQAVQTKIVLKWQCKKIHFQNTKGAYKDQTKIKNLYRKYQIKFIRFILIPNVVLMQQKFQKDPLKMSESYP